MTSSHGYETKVLRITVGVLVSCVFTVLVSMPWLCCCVIVLHDVATRENWVNTALAVCNFSFFLTFVVQLLSHVQLFATPRAAALLDHLPKFGQTHVHWVSDAIKSSHPLLSPSPPTSNLSQIMRFQWVNFLHQVAKVLEL